MSGHERRNVRHRGRNAASRGGGGRGSRNSGAHPGNSEAAPRKWILGFRKLQELECKTPSEVMFFLKSERSGFRELLNETDIFKDKLVAIWSVIAISCNSDQKENLTDFLKIVNDCNSFTVNRLQHFLLSVQNARCQPDDVHTLENVTTFLENLHVLHPSTTLSTMTLVLPILKDTVKAKLTAVGQGLLDRLDRLEEIRNTMRDRYNIQFENSVVSKDAQEPNDNFREIPIVPDRNDIITNTRPFLRPNIVSGRYRNVDHYLDIQFRLLREDFVRPLREGLSTYQENMRNGVNRRVQEVKVYNDVTVQKCMVSEAGIIHEILFPLVGGLANVQWDHSKRLIFGSLLCFSNDGFATVLFATVVNRDPKELANGKLCVRFENKDLLEVDKDYSKVYTMIETESYFEAYRHILVVLQETTESTFPLKEYIIDVDKQMAPPKFAEKENQTYCFEPLLKRQSHIGPSCCSELENRINIHRESDWSALDLGFDESQMQALKSALTQKLSIIQGPPGTGKTYVGLKIVELLLHNRKIWAPAGDKCPILIVCYTNHALDQFLEGILKATDRIVRIGGRSKCEALENFNLVQLRRQVSSRLANDYTYRNRCEIEASLRNVSTRITKIEKLQKKLRCEVLASEDLLANAKEEHLNSLKTDRPLYLPSYLDTNTLLGFWLGVEVPQSSGELLFNPDDEQQINDLGIPMEVEQEQENASASEEEIDISEPYEEDDSAAAEEVVVASEVREVENETVNVVQEEQKIQVAENAPENIPPGEVNIENLRDIDDVEFLLDQRLVDDDLDDARELFANISDSDDEAKHIQPGNDGEWKSQGGKKQKRKIITRRLKCDAMTEVELQFCKNVWSLKPVDRWRLYKTWLNSLNENCEKEIQDSRRDYERQLLLLSEVKHERERIVLNDCDVVGLTTTGAAKYKHLIRAMRSKIVIVEEAAEVLEAHIVTALTENTQQLILIGDHQQLRPNPTVYELAKKYNLEVSLFERLIKNGLPYCRLGIQHRMKPCIAKLLVPNIYSELTDHPSVCEYEPIKGMEKSMFFISHTEKEYHSQDSTSRVNTHESDFLVELCRYIMLQGYHPSKITILTTYLAQFFMLKRRMVGTMKEVRVSVVDNFQGEENDIILISFVRSNEEGAIGFLKTDNRICVSLSRAKKGLYCIGNFEIMANQSRLWQNICTELEHQEAIGPELCIKCKNHGNVVPISTARDFFKISDGGCINPCEYRLNCGHVCSRKCHPDDENHVKYACKKPCDKILCELNHKCPKQCWENCGDCLVPVEKIIPMCGHVANIPCFRAPASHVCRMLCTKLLNCSHACPDICGKECGACRTVVSAESPCGHTVRIECQYSKHSPRLLERCYERCEKHLACGHVCPNRCGSKCETSCKVLVTETLSCGHPITISCTDGLVAKSSHWDFKTLTSLTIDHSALRHGFSSRNKSDQNVERMTSVVDLSNRCSKPCNKELNCGHICKGTCGKCYQGRIHATCTEVCAKILACGHPCRSPCGKSCPPCTYYCQNRCVHSKCTSVCGTPCTPCNEPCSWRCKHKRCTRRCSESCDRTPCNKPCWKKLRCNHKCIGMCGEPCPSLCRVCDRREVTSIFFGNEDHRRAQFLQLEDCGHIFEIRGFTRWIEQRQNSAEILLITCPLCKRPLRKNMRFNNYVKATLHQIELIKTKFYGKLNVNIETKERVRNKLSMMMMICETSVPRLQLNQRDTCTKTIATDPKVIQETIHSRLTSKRVYLDQGTLALFENYCCFLDNNVEIVSKIKNIEEMKLNSCLAQMYTDTCDFIGQTLYAINAKILSNMEKGSEQLMEDIAAEFRRLSLIVNFMARFKAAFVSKKPDVQSKIAEIMNLLFVRSVFGQEQVDIFLCLQKELKSLCSELAELGITDTERISIVKAMGLTQGHWYQCPNGHVYCITECGGATVESRCNECNATIGGRSHSLRSDNRVATAMDGARHSAWPTQANMANYEL